MLPRMLLGTAVGAIGTFALDLVTYGDEVLRGRGSSGAPAKLAGVMLDKLDITLPAEGENADEKNQNRLGGIGALMGYGTGVTVGTLYGLLRPRLANVPWPVMGVLLGLAAMAASDVPLAVSGVSNPREWSRTDWLSDLIPHLSYGLVAAGVFEALAANDGNASSDGVVSLPDYAL